MQLHGRRTGRHQHAGYLGRPQPPLSLQSAQTTLSSQGACMGALVNMLLTHACLHAVAHNTSLPARPCITAYVLTTPSCICLPVGASPVLDAWVEDSNTQHDP